MKYFLTLMAALSFTLVHAQQIVHERKLMDFQMTPTGCGLERFSVATFDYEYRNVGGSKNVSRNRSVAAVWKTTDPSCLKKYGVVQYIRGCIYDLTRDPKTGDLTRSFGFNRQSRGQSIRFQHKVWEVDSIDIDPMYSSYSDPDANELNRFDWQKTPKIPLLLQADDASLAKDQRVFFTRSNYNHLMNMGPVSQAFVSDIPTGSSYNPNGAQGKEWITMSSLEFKTCLYHVKDIPVIGDPASFETPTSDGGPIQCVSWMSSVKPNFQTKNFERITEIDPFCL